MGKTNCKMGKTNCKMGKTNCKWGKPNCKLEKKKQIVNWKNQIVKWGKPNCNLKKQIVNSDFVKKKDSKRKCDIDFENFCYLQFGKFFFFLLKFLFQ